MDAGNPCSIVLFPDKNRLNAKRGVHLRIVLVMDCFERLNNGISMTTHRFAEMLRKHGHEVRVVTTGTPGKDKFIAKEKHWPIATSAILHRCAN